MTRLLLAYDGSATGPPMIAAAAALFPGAAAVIATVQPPTPTLEAASIARVALPDAMIRGGVEHMRAEHERTARTLVARGEALAVAAGLRASTAVVEGGTPWRALRTLADELEVDVIACGTRGGGALERVLLGSTAGSLLRHAGRPLLVVPVAPAPDLDGPVLAGYDESDGARRALDFAASHLRRRPLVVAHARRSLARIRGNGLVAARAAAFESYADELDDIWEPIAEDIADGGVAYAREAGLAATASVPESDSDARALLAGASAAGAAAVLVGSRGRGAVSAAVLGSVTSALVHAAALPVIVVPAASR